MSDSGYSDIIHLQHYLNQNIIGQEALALRFLIALLAGGHLLVARTPCLRCV